MGDGFPFIDIILLAMIAGFLILRLRSVLGRRTGHESQPDQRVSRRAGSTPDNVVTLPGAAQTAEADRIDEAFDAAYKGTPVEKGLKAMRAADPSFAPDTFLSGAEKAFEMIVTAYAEGDDDALKPMLSSEVYANFTKAMQARASAGETMDTEIISLKPPKFESIEVQEHRALVAVRFISEQVNVIKNAEGDVIDGDPNMIETVTDIWTFERDITSTDPNWTLVATRSES